MNLVTLHNSPQLFAYYDTWNNWLFLDWRGSLTLPGVQKSCLDLLRRCCAYPCQRVLNSGAQVHAISDDVVPWVHQEFLPFLKLVGVEQMAWVWAPVPTGQQLAREAVVQPISLDAAAFGELEAAVEWLQHTQFDQVSGCSLPFSYPSQELGYRSAHVAAFIASMGAASA